MYCVDPLEYHKNIYGLTATVENSSQQCSTTLFGYGFIFYASDWWMPLYVKQSGTTIAPGAMAPLRDWSRSVGSYGNNTRVICCPAPGHPESAARGTSLPDNKSRGCCCRNSRPTVINPDYNMTKQRCIYDKIHPKPPPNLATSPTCLHCDVTHLSLTTGVVALHIPSWRIEVREERRQARKIVWPVNAGRVICRYQNNLCGIINHHKHIRYCFLDV